MIKTLDPQEMAVPELHGLLLAAVAPRPIAFASTINKKGEVNLSPFSFFNVFSANPPVMIFSPARRGRDNTTKHTYENVKDTAQVVINIVNYHMVEQMSLASTEYDQGINEFTKAGLTESPSQKVKPPRVKESPVSFECEVDQVIELGDQGGAGNLVIARVVLIHVQDQFFNDSKKLDPTGIDQVARMGGNWYCRASSDALFEIPKPLTIKGIGVDQLPASIRESEVLTGNNLGRLGNVEQLPTDETIRSVMSDTEVLEILEEYQDQQHRIKAFHELAQRLLQAHDTEKALGVLLVADQIKN